MKLALVPMAVALLFSFNVKADGQCANYNSTTGKSTVRVQQQKLQDVNFVKQIARQHLACAVSRNATLRATREALKAAALDNSGGFSADIGQAQTLVKSSWISERGSANQDGTVSTSGEYQIESVEAISTGGVGTGLFSGIIANIRTVINVLGTETFPMDDEGPVSGQFTLEIVSTNSDLSVQE
jgi:hypothetical protein